MSAKQQSEPAWLPDPKGSGMLRWFDGESWTGHLSSFPAPSGPPGAEQPRPDHSWILTPGYSRRAIVAWYFALSSLLLFPAPISAFVGLWALADLRNNPGQKGLARAWFAVCAGVAGTVGLLLFSVNVLK